MRFLLFTDLHQKRSVVDKINDMAERHGAEFVVCLGDVTDMGTVEDARGILSAIRGRVYAIPGNCDPLDLPGGLEGVAVDMHGRAEEIGGLRFVGLGGSNITIFGTPFELEEDDIYDALEGISEEGMVLMTHAPSFGTLDQIPSGQSVGSPAIRDIVERYHPILAMSGHIHEAVGVVERDGTTFVNPGPAKDGHMAVVDITDGRVSVELIGPTDHRCPRPGWGDVGSMGALGPPRRIWVTENHRINTWSAIVYRIQTEALWPRKGFVVRSCGRLQKFDQ